MLEMKNGEIRITFDNGISLSLKKEGESFIGISDVLYGDVPMRSTAECIMPEFATPDGIEADSFLYLDAWEEDGTVYVKTRPVWRIAHRMEWQEHGGHYRISTKGWTNRIHDEGTTLTWIIRPEEEVYGDVPYQGFSYGYRYSSETYKIYQIEDKATWEIGGSIEGNTLLMKNPFQHSFQHFETDMAFDSGWTIPGINNPYAFQHLPFYTHLQGFVFQYSPQYLLLTEFDHPSHIRTHLAKEKGSHIFAHFNQYCFDLTGEKETAKKKVMFAKNTFKEPIELYNHFIKDREEITKKVHEYYDIVLDEPRPCAHVESWTAAKLENFEKVFDKMGEWNFKRAFIMPLWRSNETDVIPRFKEDRERFGVLGNMCCPLDLNIADCYGGKEGIAKVFGGARDRGLETYTWFGSHFSAMSNLGSEIRDLWASDPNGQNARNNYGGVLFAVNQNSKKYQDYLVNTFRELGEMGLRGVFRDSHFNMASDTLNYRQTPYEKELGGVTPDQVDLLKNRTDLVIEPSVTSMHDTEIAIQRRFQKELGMLYYVESAGIIGTNFGGTRHGVVREAPWVYSRFETAIYTDVAERFGDDLLMAYFKGLSVKVFYQLQVDVNAFPEKGSVSDWWDEEKMPKMHQDYYEVEPYMARMSLVGYGDTVQAIRWYGNGPEPLFVYEDMEYSAGEGKEVFNVTDQKTEAVDEQGKVHLEGMKVYLIK